jgi:hypothetical protein
VSSKDAERHSQRVVRRVLPEELLHEAVQDCEPLPDDFKRMLIELANDSGSRRVLRLKDLFKAAADA